MGNEQGPRGGSRQSRKQVIPLVGWQPPGTAGSLPAVSKTGDVHTCKNDCPRPVGNRRSQEKSFHQGADFADVGRGEGVHVGGGGGGAD